MSSNDIFPRVSTHASREDLGQQAAARAAAALRNCLEGQQTACIMLAAAPSQEATLSALIVEPGIDWSRVECFHMDEYVGLAAEAPQGFANWLEAHFCGQVAVAAFHRIDPLSDSEQEAERYTREMGIVPFDLVLLGLGVNGHLGFNDPPADLTDQHSVRVVELDRTSRQQQVDEGHFACFDDVPRTALTVTIPRLLNASEIIASVPGASKRQAVSDSLFMPISGTHPGTALRRHSRVFVFLDRESTPTWDSAQPLFGEGVL